MRVLSLCFQHRAWFHWSGQSEPFDKSMRAGPASFCLTMHEACLDLRPHLAAGLDVAAALKSLQVDRTVGPVSKAGTCGPCLSLAVRISL